VPIPVEHPLKNASFVSPPLLIEETARVLRELIVAGELEPGRRLSEREIGSQLGISRTPLREALRLLASERLVELLPRRGARVALLDSATVEDVFPVLMTLERLAVDLACKLMGEDEIARLRDMQARMGAARRRREKRRFFAVSQDFHDSILAASANATLQATYARLSGQVRRIQFMSLDSEAEWEEALREHEAIVRALEKRNAAAAVKAITQHLDAKKKKVLRQLAVTSA
jgi:DNA-binding GntR family transcriptional regulator